MIVLLALIVLPSLNACTVAPNRDRYGRGADGGFVD
jgi:hypothetical protein